MAQIGTLSVLLYRFLLFQIYDVTTGQRLLRLYDSEQANNYKANIAVFNPTDELVLNDGVLWDARSGELIHKFDKFNQFVSGVFHPSGLEIIINSEVVSFCKTLSESKLVFWVTDQFKHKQACTLTEAARYEPRCEKTGFLHMRKQRRRSASW